MRTTVTGEVVWGSLLVLLVAALAWSPVLVLHHTRTVTVQVPQPPPTASTPAGEMQERLGSPQGSVPGSQINPQLPGTCDVYQGNTWIVLLCH